MPDPGGPRVTLDGLTKALRQHQLLSPAQLEELPRLACSDLRSLARQMIDRHWLTPFQVNLLLQGRSGDLVLGAYLVLERLGEGGAGQVFKARHTNLKRVVAIKLIRKELLTDPSAVQRFYREIRVVSQLSHANVVHAFDAGPMGNSHALIMEYVEGTDLGKMVKQHGPLPVRQACDYVRQAALGLQHVHERGLVHRDIKPSNLLLTAREGLVKVLDLGLARLTANGDGHGETKTLTEQGTLMMGTPDYMAPEQAISLHDVDIRADVYSLGCTLFYLLTGQSPYPGGTLAQKLMRHQQAPLPSLQQFRTDVPPDLEPILGRMLAKLPAQRYQTPAELAVNLTAMLAGSVSATDSVTVAVATAVPVAIAPEAALLHDPALVPVAVAVPVDAPLIAKPARRRWRWPALAAVCLALLVGLVLAVSGPHRGTSIGSADGTDSSKPVGSTGNTVEPGEVASVLGDPRGRQNLPIAAIAFSPDSKTIACGGADRVLHIWDAAAGTQTTTLPVSALGIGLLAFSADGRVLAGAPAVAFKDSEVKVWETAGGKEVFSAPVPEGLPLAVSLAPDGKTLFLFCQRSNPQFVGELHSWDIATGRKNPSWTSPPAVRGLLSPAGDFLAITPNSDHHGVQTFSTTVPAAKPPASVVAVAHILQVAFAPDGQWFGTVAQAAPGGRVVNTVQLWEPATARERPGMKKEGVGGITSFALAPRGTLIALAGPVPAGSAQTHDLRLWDPATNQERVVRAAHGDAIRTLAFAPNGKTLASAGADGTLRVWDVPTLKERFPESGHQGPVAALAFAGKGPTLISQGVGDRTVRFWDPQRGKLYSRRVVDLGISQSRNGFLPFVLPDSEGRSLLLWGDRGVKSWDTASDQTRDVFNGNQNDVLAVAATPDGRTAALVLSYQTHLRVFDVAGHREIRKVPLDALTNPQVAFSPDGKLLAFTAHKQEPPKNIPSADLKIWDTASGVERFSLPRFSGMVAALAFAPDSQTIAISTIRQEAAPPAPPVHEIRWFEVGSGKEKLKLPHTPGAQGTLMFAPSGQVLLSGDVWGNVRVWDLAANKERFSLVGLNRPAVAVFSPDSERLLIATSTGNQVLALDAQTRKQLLEWSLPVGSTVQSMALTADGRHVAVGSSSGLIYLFPTSPR